MNELRIVKEEDIIWLISFFLIILVILSNKYEKEFLCTNDIRKKKLSSNITTSVLIIALFIYLYFVITSFNNLKNLQASINNSEVRIAFERFITSILFLAAGIYALYTQYDALKNNLDESII